MIREFDIRDIREGQTLADFLREQGIRLILPCGGNGTCGKCRIHILNTDTWLLACDEKGDASLFHLLENSDTLRIEIPDDEIEGDGSLFHPSEGQKDEKGTRPLFHLAVDLGSTTIESAALTPEGEVIGSVQSANPQRTYGADVISRIRAASEGTIAASDMQRLAESAIQAQIQELSERYGLRDKPEVMAIAGNTTMEHLLAGDDVEPLGHAPYDPGDIALRNISRVFFDDGTPVYLLPGISAYVGADIVSGICYTGMDLGDDVSLLIDLGTNGEMAIGNREKLIVTSTAAGPAFEAANISCGCAGVPGAITGVRFTGERVHLIQMPWDEDMRNLSPGEKMQEEMRLKAKRPAGLCGSGLVSTVAAMKRAGIIDENGTYTRDEWIEKGFTLWSNRRDPDIRLTQDDIHELLLAKAAIASGIEILLSSTHQMPSRVYLAGGFGEGISVSDAFDIGLFPDEIKDTVITPVGNSSLKGAEQFLKDPVVTAERMERIVSISREIHLSDADDFEKLYISNMKI